MQTSTIKDLLLLYISDNNIPFPEWKTMCRHYAHRTVSTLREILEKDYHAVTGFSDDELRRAIESFLDSSPG